MRVEFDQKTIAKVFEVSQATIIRWEKEEGFPVIREDGKNPYYDLVECLKHKKGKHWKVYYDEIVDINDEEKADD